MYDDTVVSFSHPEKISIDDPLTEVLRAGASRLLIRAVEAEVQAFLAAHEHLVDDAGRRFSYRVKKNPFVPYDDYHATVTVEAAGVGARVTIESTFELDGAADDALATEDERAQAARDALSASYRIMVDALALALGTG